MILLLLIFSSVFISLSFSQDCGIPVLTETPTIDYFLKEFDLKTPFLLKGGAKSWKATESWRHEQLDLRFGDAEVKVGFSSQILANSGDGSESMKLRDFLSTLRDVAAGNNDANEEGGQEETPYVFDRGHFVKEHPEILADFVPPPFFSEKESVIYYFLLGGPRSGVSLHAHTDGWNGLVHGRKRWFFYPPNVLPPLDFPVYRGQIKWEKEIYPQIKENPTLPAPLECTQESGDIIYIPEGWFHATTNLEETIGVRHNLLGFHFTDPNESESLSLSLGFFIGCCSTCEWSFALFATISAGTKAEACWQTS
jgi:hypothetical protein